MRYGALPISYICGAYISTNSFIKWLFYKFKPSGAEVSVVFKFVFNTNTNTKHERQHETRTSTRKTRNTNTKYTVGKIK